MKVRNIVRKAAVLGSTGVMVAATMAGALAYDLADYPAQFISDGVFDGTIVVGERAATADVVGSIDIAASLQASSTSEVDVPGVSGKTELKSEGYKLETGSDQLELREPIGDVVDTVSEYELPGLKSGRITTSEGDTEYFQYLRFKDGNNLQDMAVNFVQNDDNDMDMYLVVDETMPFMEWEIQFPEGFESGRDSNGDLDDLEDETFNILGTDYTVVRATVDADGTDFNMVLMGGSIADTLREGETRTYSIDGVDYEVTLVFVSDPNSGTVETKFSVNGELTQALNEGETDTLSGGLQIGIRDILVNAREGVVSFFLGADKVEMSDTNVNDTDTFQGTIEINNENINDGDLEVQAAFTSGTTKFEITDIKYRLKMDAESSSIQYLPPGHGVREFMRRPQSMISDSLDLYFSGLADIQTTPIELNARGDDRYELSFTNIQGREYRVPYVSNEDGVWKFGDDNDAFVFVEGDSFTDYVIGDNDYFVVSNTRSSNDRDKSVTNALRYEDYDNTDFTLDFTDLSTDSTVSVPVSDDGMGNLVIGGHTYKVNVSNRSANSPKIAIDLNADGDAANDIIDVTAWGGVIISLAERLSTNSTVNNTPGAIDTSIAGAGAFLTLVDREDAVLDVGVNTEQEINMSMTVLSKNFDTSGNGDEVLNWSVRTDNSNQQVDMDVRKQDYKGPQNNQSNEWTKFDFNDPSDDLDDWNYGYTDWGVLVKEYDPTDSDTPNELFLEVPQSQRTAEVFVTLGTVETRKAGGTTSTQVNPIAVGMAVLDRDAPAIGSDNLIVVGGPCANTVAAELLGNPENCAEGFEPGKAIIRAWDQGDTVAILVAGYSAQDTQGATRVLAQYEDYGLSGSEVEVVVADLNSITVQAPTVKAAEDTTADETA